jgi:hypothetical protein
MESGLLPYKGRLTMRRFFVMYLVIIFSNCSLLFPDLILKGASPEGDKFYVYYYSASLRTHTIHVKVCLSKQKRGECFESEKISIYNDGNIVSKYDSKKVKYRASEWTKDMVVFNIGESRVTYKFREDKISSEIIK